MYNRRRSVLIAENDRAIAAALRLHLEREGFSVFVAHDGEQAAILAARQRFELMVLNHNLPTMTGTELCKHVREDLQLTEVPIAICAVPSGDAEAEYLSYQYGASIFYKPIDPTTIADFARTRMTYLVAVN